MAVFILKTNDVSGCTRAKIFQSVSVNASLSSSRLKTGIRCIMHYASRSSIYVDASSTTYKVYTS